MDYSNFDNTSRKILVLIFNQNNSFGFIRGFDLGKIENC
jgi:hypothetical protein